MSTYYVQHHFFSTQTTSILMMIGTVTFNSSFGATLALTVDTATVCHGYCQLVSLHHVSQENMSWCQLEILSPLRLLTLSRAGNDQSEARALVT